MIADCRKRAFLVLTSGVGLVSAFGVGDALHPAAAAEFQCRHDDLLRRVEVNTGEAARDAACEVRYWRDGSSPPEGQVLWQATQDIDFCHAKARDLLARLEAGGWACGPSDSPGEPGPSPQTAARATPSESPASAAAPEAPPPEAAEPDEPAPTAASVAPLPPAAQPAPPSTATAEPSAPVAQSSASDAKAEAAAPSEPPPPAVTARQEPAAPVEKQSASGGAAVAPAAPSEEQSATVAATVEPAAPSEQPATRAIARVEPSAPAEAMPEPPADGPHAALLDRVVGQTLQSVQQMYGGDFRAEDTAFGDLDGDGRDDAAVLITYESDQEDYVQYLVAYLFDGETFQSTATKNVGGRFLDAVRADVREIIGRAIVVDLQALDASEVCCETRRAAFVLREGQLVEVENPAGAPRGRT